jgi:hypothetical protein
LDWNNHSSNGCPWLIVSADSFIAPKITKNELWDTGLAVMPEWAKHAVNFFVGYAYISMAVLVILLALSGTAGGDLQEENGKYFLQKENGLRRELTSVEYNVSKTYQDAGIASFMSLIYLIQAVYAYGYYIIKQRRR